MVMVGMLLALGAGAGLAADHGSKPKQAMFKTKAEAEAAATMGGSPMGNRARGREPCGRGA